MLWDFKNRSPRAWRLAWKRNVFKINDDDDDNRITKPRVQVRNRIILLIQGRHLRGLGGPSPQGKRKKKKKKKEKKEREL